MVGYPSSVLYITLLSAGVLFRCFLRQILPVGDSVYELCCMPEKKKEREKAGLVSMQAWFPNKIYLEFACKAVISLNLTAALRRVSKLRECVKCFVVCTVL